MHQGRRGLPREAGRVGLLVSSNFPQFFFLKVHLRVAAEQVQDPHAKPWVNYIFFTGTQHFFPQKVNYELVFLACRFPTSLYVTGSMSPSLPVCQGRAQFERINREYEDKIMKVQVKIGFNEIYLFLGGSIILICSRPS